MPASAGERLKSGVPDLDELLDGLILGDNVVWVVEETDVMACLEDALLTEAIRRRQRCMYVTASSDPARLRGRLDPSVTILDARPRGTHSNAAALEAEIIQAARGAPPACVVVGARHPSRTTQRKPMWLVDVSIASPWRAAGR